jgi:hypothetical protein
MQTQNLHDKYCDYEENTPSPDHRLIKSSMVVDTHYNVVTGELTKYYDALFDTNLEIDPHSIVRGRYSNKVYAHRFSITGKTWGLYTMFYAIRKFLIH